MPEYKVSIDQLREGVFIRLEQKWFEHPFLFNSFKIDSQEQLSILRELGISQATCIPEKSDVLPLPHQQTSSSTAEKPALKTPIRAAESVEPRNCGK